MSDEEEFGERFLSDNEKAFEKVFCDFHEAREVMLQKEYEMNRKSFEENGYIVVSRHLVSDEMAELVTQYGVLEMLNSPELPGDSQVPGTFSNYADTLTESLLHLTQGQIESRTGKNLIPTYSYYRVYKAGDMLPDHTDRPACEISATIMMGFRYDHGPIPPSTDYNWCLHGYVNGEKVYFPHSATGAVIYKGCELVHGRDRFDVNDYSYQVQVFLHYVDADGPYAEEHKYDKRPAIGLKKETITRLYGDDSTDR